MGGKTYFCDYCQCYMKNDLNVRKSHNSGLSHTIAKYTFMRRFDDPKKILNEETAKLPCPHYAKGYCKFDLFCVKSHFNAQQIEALKKVVSNLEKSKTIKKKPTSSREEIPLPWNQMQNKRQRRKIRKLPISLRPMQLHRLNGDCFKESWS